MKTALITGSAGLIGAEAVRFLHAKGFATVGIDNDSRSAFFGPEASTASTRAHLQDSIPGYRHYAIDIRDRAAVERLLAEHGSDIALVVHTAAQPSHDWAASDPHTDFSINATGTLVLLEAVRQHCPDAVFVFTSTNKVYGDRPNTLPLVERARRWELPLEHPLHAHGIPEDFPIDQSKHSLFGVSKVAADLLVQEYGRYFGLKTVVFRGGCLTGPGHAGAEAHGFLSYLVKCTLLRKPYTIYGYKGKQVRDNIHAHDLVNMFWHSYQAPRCGEVYNAGGGRHSNCSVLEAIDLLEELTGERLQYTLSEQNRSGDHIWYISDTRKFQQHHPAWRQAYDLRATLAQMCQDMDQRLSRPGRESDLLPAAGA